MGKSALIIRFINNEFSNQNQPTIGKDAGQLGLHSVDSQLTLSSAGVDFQLKDFTAPNGTRCRLAVCLLREYAFKLPLHPH